MTCEEAKIQMLGEAQGEEFAAHIASCEACRSEVSRVGALWQSLDLLPREEPSGKVRERFYEMLGAYRQGLAFNQERASSKAGGWLRTRAWQLAAAAALVAVGIGIGYGVRDDRSRPELVQLREEVTNMRQLVALSLLQQQSASERLRGVSWAYQAEPSDREVLGALVTAVNHDSNVNVRLAAVDALRRFAASPETRRAVVDALPTQTTPLVQVALIDLLVDFKDRDAAGALKTLAANREVNDGVRQQARWALEKLQ
ncbi:MAG TPA: HEAT repeat domain-containing protein [Bryobacteraceae bacterium]|nr:HEAT repeat domain-containing protein [Bryobacteraceae bacterium]